MANPDFDAPTQRILSVVEVISAKGPITLEALCRTLPISRAALWRALNTLRHMGWVRMRAGDNAFEMRAEIVERLQKGHTSHPMVENLSPLIAALSQIGPVHVDLGGFTATGVFHILETTRKGQENRPSAALSLVDEDIAIAAQLTIPPPDLVLNLRAFMVTARDDERRIITSGEHGRAIARLRDDGYLWGPDRTSLSMSITDFPGFALRAELWRVTRADIARFETNVMQFLAAHTASVAFVNPLSSDRRNRV